MRIIKRKNHKSEKGTIKAPIDALCVDKTKLDTNFPERQLKIPGD